MSALVQRTLDLIQFYSDCDPDFHFSSEDNPKRVLTSNYTPVGNDGFDNSDYDYILQVNGIIGDKIDKQYKIKELLGCGTFGQVAKCIHLTSQRRVAVKIIKNKSAYLNQSLMEIKVLNQVYQSQSRLRQETPFSLDLPLIKLYDHFHFRKHLCLVFELLSINLYDLIKQNGFKGFRISLVRDFTTQLLDALIILGQAKVVHCDLKPENILLCELDSTQIKIIDFGSSCYEQSTMYTYVQSRFYRAPEVILGLEYSSSIDMWSLGCIVAELFLGLPIFPGTSEYNQLSRIHDMLGPFPLYMLEVGKKTKDYFNKSVKLTKPHYSLKPMSQYNLENHTKEVPGKRYFQQDTLEDIIMHYPAHTKMSREEMDQEFYLRQCLIDFLKQCLEMNPLKRLSPQQAKLHDFISGKLDHFRPRHASQPLQPQDKPQLKKSSSDANALSLTVKKHEKEKWKRTKSRDELKELNTGLSYMSDSPQSAGLPVRKGYFK